MRRRIAIATVVLSVVLESTAARAQPALRGEPGPSQTAIPQRFLALVNANALNVRSGAITSAATIVVRDGRIVSVGTGAAPSGAEVVDVKGRWVVPGLIDAHTHLETMDAARRAVMSGVTTARSASVSAFQDVAIREFVSAGYLAGPDMLAAGIYVTPNDPEWLADPKMVSVWPRVDTAERLRRLVRLNKERGATVIKTRGTERAGRPDTDPREQVYTAAELRTVVDEARTLGMDVLCHTHGTEGSEAAIQAGVRSIEHGTYLTDAQLKTMAVRGIYWVPTYSTLIDLVEPGGDYDNPIVHNRGLFMLPVAKRALAAGIVAGVKIVTGADSSYGPESTTRISHEVANFVSAGMAPLQALQAATVTAAELLRLDGKVGVVAAGFEADLIVIEANPLVDVRALQDPLFVMSNGRVAVNRLEFGREGR